MWIDSHCHLNHPKIEEAGSPADLIKSAHKHNVDGLVTICCRISEELETLTAIAGAHDNVWCSIGTHPHDAGKEEEKTISVADIARLANDNPKIIGIGETGLDYYYDNSPRPDQKVSFEKHIEACLETDLPIIIHARDADEDVADILTQAAKDTNLSGVMHCFSSGPALAKAALDIGFYISFSGIVTFKQADELRDIAKTVPHDRILVETDAPFLAPLPHRGKTNIPGYVQHTGAFLADWLEIPVQDFARQTTQNFFTLFQKAKTSYKSV